MGVATGERSGIVVIDFDTMEALEAMEVDPARPLPPTFTVKTPRGMHLYYQWPGFYCKNSAGQLAPHVDVRGDGGFVVAPGSPHKSGEYYERVDDLPVAPMPAWLLEWPGLRLQDRGQFAQAGDNAPVPVDVSTERGQRSIALARAYLEAAVPASDATAGVRWEMCLHLVRYLLLPVETAFDLIVESGYPERCNPPWEHGNVAHKLEEARDRSDRPAGGVDLEGFAARVAASADEHAKAVAEGRESADEHAYTFDPINSRRTPRTYQTKDGTTKTAGLMKADFDHLVCELNGDPDWHNVIRFNEFDHRIYVFRPPMPLDAEAGVPRFAGSDVSALRVWLAYAKDAAASKEDITDAVEVISKGHKYHPIKAWFETLPTPETNHLDGLAAVLFGDTRPEAQLFLRKQLIASVARVFEPGCKVDSVLTLVGPKGGEKKTSTIEALYKVPACRTFRSDLPEIRDMQKVGQALEGVWCVEMAELDVIKKSDEDALKSFLTRREERYSPKYVAGEVCRPRQCVFWGSTNDEEFLPRYDAAFRRRFWVVNVSQRVDTAWLEAHRDEIWAEAFAAYQAGGDELYWFDDEGQVDQVKEEHVVADAWAADVRAAVKRLKPLTEDPTKRVITSVEVWRMLPGNVDRMPSDGDIKKVARILKDAGLEPFRKTKFRGFVLRF